MKIGILGSGTVGQMLAEGFAKKGYEVKIASRNKEKQKEIEEKIPGIKTGDFNETADYGDLIILAVKGTASEEVIKNLSEETIKGKIIIDATNPIADNPPSEGVLSFFTDLNESLMERLQEIKPNARFVKAFNSIGSSLMINPDFNGTKPTMFICGNDSGAKEEATKILDEFGFEVEDMGSVKSARAIEPLCILWCIPGFLNNEWNHAFRFLKKE